jgi:hypothetical protein
MKNTTWDYCDCVPVAADPKIVLMVDKVHEKVGPRQPNLFDDLPTYQAAGGDYGVNQAL